MYDYIIIMVDDCSMIKATEVTLDDMNSADSGELELIRVSDLSRYDNGEWHPLLGTW